MDEPMDAFLDLIETRYTRCTDIPPVYTIVVLAMTIALHIIPYFSINKLKYHGFRKTHLPLN